MKSFTSLIETEDEDIIHLLLSQPASWQFSEEILTLWKDYCNHEYQLIPHENIIYLFCKFFSCKPEQFFEQKELDHSTCQTISEKLKSFLCAKSARK